MSKPKWTLANFKHAGQGHLHGATRVLDHLPAGGGPEPARTPASAAYLAHVAVLLDGIRVVPLEKKKRGTR